MTSNKSLVQKQKTKVGSLFSNWTFLGWTKNVHFAKPPRSL